MYLQILRDAFQDVYCINVIFIGIIAFLCRCNSYGLGYMQFLRLHNMLFLRNPRTMLQGTLKTL